MKALQEEYGDRGFRLVAINSNDAENYPADSFDAMMPGRRSRSSTSTTSTTTSRSRGVRAGAHARGLLFDRNRRLVYHGAIDDSREEDGVTERYVRDAIEALLADQDPPSADAARGLFGQE